jgi:hypothetical protein
MLFPIALILFIAGEFVVGWWALPAVALVLGLIAARRTGGVAMITGAAVLAWGLLFAWNAMHGNLGGFMSGLAGSMKVKPGQLYSAITIIPAALAGLAARLGAGLIPQAPAEPVTAAAPGTPAATAFKG